MLVAAERRRPGGLYEPDESQPRRVQVAGERKRAGGLHEPDDPRPQHVLFAAIRITTMV